MKIAFLTDHSTKTFVGGANVTDSIMIGKGIELGHEITEFNFKDLKDEDNAKKLDGFDLIILSNINSFKIEVIQDIVKNKKYITYCHDYLFCKSRSAQCKLKCKITCTPAKIYQDLYANSLLNIFLSPLQLDIHRKFFRATMRDAVYIPSPIIKDVYFPELNIQQDAYLYLGVIMNHKGVSQILDYAEGQKNKVFHFAGKPVNQELIKRIKDKHHYLGQVNHKDVPKLLRKYKFFMINPQWPEPFGRTIIEAMCSGCTLIKFEKSDSTGLESYDLSPKNMIDLCIDAPNIFWDKIKEVEG